MDLIGFLRETQADVATMVQDGIPHSELAFTEIVMKHMAEIGMTFEPVSCHVKNAVGKEQYRLSGYAISDDDLQLDLFVTLYDGVDKPTSVPPSEIKEAAEQCLSFLSLSAAGKLAPQLDESDDARTLAQILHDAYDELENVRVYLLTDRVAKSKFFKTRTVAGKAVRMEIMDIERLHRHLSEGKPRDELLVDFIDVSGAPLPCVFVPGDNDDYDYALTAIPGEALRLLYEKFGARLLEANVRSFLSVKGRKTVNAGIQATLRSTPSRFMAYNNGIVIVADEMRMAISADRANGIAWLKGLQIVNGGQTTASLYFAKKRYPDTDLSRVRVPAKIIVMRTQDAVAEEALVSDISRYANSQNAVSQSDLSANKPFHVAIERLSLSVYCPDGVGRWFYERAAGSYATMLARDGNTEARLKALKEAIPASRRITKTDLAKYIVAWNQQPDFVSLGAQKNFDKFMGSIAGPEGAEAPTPTVAEYKIMIAKAKLFRDTAKYSLKAFKAGQANVAAYTIAVLAQKLGDRLDLEKVWNAQGASPELTEQIKVWAAEVNELFTRTSNGRLVSEWAKKPECKDVIMSSTFSRPAAGIPELR
jgi:hypothetical protein